MARPHFVSKAYGSGVSLDDVGGIFSLLLSRSARRTPVDFFFLGRGGGLVGCCCLFSSLFLFLSAVALSFSSFFSCLSLSVLTICGSVSMIAYRVGTAGGWRVDLGGGGMGSGRAKIDVTVSIFFSSEEEATERATEGSESRTG